MKYSRPILSRIFDLFACIVFVGAGLCAVAFFAGETQPGLLGAGALIVAGIIYIGIGQVIDYLARTAYNTSELLRLAENNAVSQAVAQASLPAAAAHAPAPFKSPAKSAPRKFSKYFYSVDGGQEGPFEAFEIKSFRDEGVITDSTPVIMEGDSEWRTFRHYPDLVR